MNLNRELCPLVDLDTLLIKLCPDPNKSSSLKLEAYFIFVFFLDQARKSLASLRPLHVFVQIENLHLIVEELLWLGLFLINAFLEWPIVFKQSNAPLVPTVRDQVRNNLVAISLSVLDQSGINNILLRNAC